MTTPTCETIAADVMNVFDAVEQNFLLQPFYPYTIATETTTIPPPPLAGYAEIAQQLEEIISSVPATTVGQCPLTQTAADITNNTASIMSSYFPAAAFSYDSLSDCVMNGPYSFLLKPSGNTAYWGQIDLSFYESIPVMEGLAQYGGIGYFDKTDGLQAILYLGTLYTLDNSEFSNILNVFASTMSFHVAVWVNLGNILFGSIQNFTNVASQNYNPDNVDNDILTMMTYGVSYISSLSTAAAGIFANVWSYDLNTILGMVEQIVAAGPLTREQILGWSETSYYQYMSNYILSVTALFDALNVQPVGDVSNGGFSRDRIVDMFCLNALNAFTGPLGIKMSSNYAIFPARVYSSSLSGGWTVVDQNWALVSTQTVIHPNYQLNSATAIGYFSANPVRQIIYKLWTDLLPFISPSYFAVNSFNISVAS